MPPLFPQTLVTKAGWIAAISLTTAAVLLHFFSFTQVGGLWRDEIGIANIARMPSWPEVFRGLPHDHCPIMFPALVRSWTALGLARTDTGLRVLGLCIGLLLMASFWAASRMMGGGLPLLALSLIALNPVVIRYGDSIRGYALGMVFIVLALGLIWRFIEAPGARRGLLAAAAAVASVQTLYQNAFFLLAICIAGMIVCLRRRQPGPAIAVLGMGFLAALSLLPYVNPIRNAQSWWLVSQSGTSLAISLDRLSRLTGSFLVVWVLVVVLAAVSGIGRAFVAASRTERDDRRDLSLFAGLALVLGTAGFGVFIKLTGLPTQVWYYIPVLCFTVVCCDATVSRARPAVALGVLAIAGLALVISPSAYSALRWRQTNGDLLAGQVTKDAAASDLIIVHPWYYGLTFGYYYRGAAKWTTLPPIEDHRFHRYDLIKAEIQMTNAITPVLKQVEATLRSGNRVWIVGGIPVPPFTAAKPANPPPAPNGPLGWSDRPYSDAWGAQLGYLLEHHITNATLLVDPATNFIPVNPMERMLLESVSGWQTNPP